MTVYDEAGSAAVLDPGDYRLDTAARPARLVVSANAPAPGGAVNGIEIDFTAGYGTATDVPGPLKLAIKQLAAHWYENRETDPGGEVPGRVHALLTPYRLICLGTRR